MVHTPLPFSQPFTAPFRTHLRLPPPPLFQFLASFSFESKFGHTIPGRQVCCQLPGNLLGGNSPVTVSNGAMTPSVFSPDYTHHYHHPRPVPGSKVPSMFQCNSVVIHVFLYCTIHTRKWPSLVANIKRIHAQVILDVWISTVLKKNLYDLDRLAC